MQPILITMSVLALMIAPALRENTGLQHQSSNSKTPQNTSDFVSIEAYAKMLDRYFKSHPQMTRYYAEVVPEGDASASTGTGEKWRQVKDEKAMYDADVNGLTVSMKDGQIVYADIYEPLEHSSTDTSYYFRPDGTLAKINSGFYSNMAGARILKMRYYDANGKLLKSSNQCFSITFSARGQRERRTSCSQSDMRPVLDGVEFQVYRKNTELPGYDMLKKH